MEEINVLSTQTQKVMVAPVKSCGLENLTPMLTPCWAPVLLSMVKWRELDPAWLWAPEVPMEVTQVGLLG